MHRPRLVIVSDNPQTVRLIANEARNDFDALVTPVASPASDALPGPDVVILDLAPGTEPASALREVKERFGAPVVVLLPKGYAAHGTRLLNLGADDCLTLPRTPREVLAKVRAILRRTSARAGLLARGEAARPAGGSGGRYACGPTVIDLERCAVFRDGQAIPLTRLEWLLLRHLCVHANRVVTHEDLLTVAWGSALHGTLQNLRAWISRIRRKIEPDPARPQFLRTVPGVGYVLRAEPVRDVPPAAAPHGAGPLPGAEAPPLPPRTVPPPSAEEPEPRFHAAPWGLDPLVAGVRADGRAVPAVSAAEPPALAVPFAAPAPPAAGPSVPTAAIRRPPGGVLPPGQSA